MALVAARVPAEIALVAMLLALVVELLLLARLEQIPSVKYAALAAPLVFALCTSRCVFDRAAPVAEYPSALHLH
jgi:hypothetical protein